MVFHIPISGYTAKTHAGRGRSCCWLFYLLIPPNSGSSEPQFARRTTKLGVSTNDFQLWNSAGSINHGFPHQFRPYIATVVVPQWPRKHCWKKRSKGLPTSLEKVCYHLSRTPRPFIIINNHEIFTIINQGNFWTLCQWYDHCRFIVVYISVT